MHADDGKAGRAVEAFGRDARVVVVASDHADSLRGAYAELKTLSQTHAVENFEIVAPRFEGGEASLVAFANLSNAARRFLDIELVDGGSVVVPRPKVDVARTSLLVRTKTPTSDETPASDAVPQTFPTHAEVPHAAAVA